MRPNRTDIFLEVAISFAKRSTCPRAQVGTVIVNDGHIISHGYNGAPPGQPHCLDVGCELTDGCQRAIHAEANALAWAARAGVRCNGASMFSTHEPCRKCAELALSAGITQVFFLEMYRQGASQFLADAGITVAHIGPGTDGMRRKVKLFTSHV